jgi:hypothetical protein
MEKAIIVLVDMNKAAMRGDQHTSDALKELNDYLSQGWSVKKSCAMGGTGHMAISSSLVILEKKG